MNILFYLLLHMQANDTLTHVVTVVLYLRSSHPLIQFVNISIYILPLAAKLVCLLGVD